MKTWEFTDIETGEDFFVEADTKEEAIAKAKQYFDTPKCYGAVTDFEAEMLGYDTY